MNVTIDVRENEKRITKAKKYYTNQGLKVNTAELQYGDYLFKNNSTNIETVFEYKTIEDYIASIRDNRVFNQALNQSNNFDYHFVMIVGTEKEKQKIIKKNKHYTGKYISNEQYYGAYASLLNITNVIHVNSEKTAFKVMEQLATKCCDNKPVLKKFHKSRGSPALRLLANNVSRIGYKKAEKICDELNLYSINDVLCLTVDDLVLVDGVGVRTAERIINEIKGEFDL